MNAQFMDEGLNMARFSQNTNKYTDTCVYQIKKGTSWLACRFLMCESQICWGNFVFTTIET